MLFPGCNDPLGRNRFARPATSAARPEAKSAVCATYQFRLVGDMTGSEGTTRGNPAFGELVYVLASWAQVDTVLGGAEAR